jgi:outer membrane autotransporter protein
MASVSRRGLWQACALGFCVFLIAGNANARCYVTNLGQQNITPNANFGVIAQFNMGGTASGSFGNGDAFDIAQIDGQRTMGDLGVGVDVTLHNGVALYTNYDAQVWGSGNANAVIGGVRIS